tara:strand:+ start:1176 stop:1604 length:429 start_codon:yes stop_codon:yes gene_type:complete
MSLDRESAIKILKAKSVVSAPQKYTVKVNSVSAFDNGQTAFIVNFDIMNAYQKTEAMALFAEGKFQEACNKGLSLSIRATDYLPAKGETVDIEVGNITLKSGEIALLATSLIPRQAVAPTKSSWDFDEELVEESTSEDGDLA